MLGASIKYNKDSVSVKNCYKLKCWEYVMAIAGRINSDYKYPECMKDIEVITLARELAAHIQLYEWGYKQDRTKDCDLNIEPWYRRLGYFILSLIYKITH